VSDFYTQVQLTLLQCFTTTLQHFNISLCEEDRADRHPYRKAGDHLRSSTRFVYSFELLLVRLLSIVHVELEIIFSSGDGHGRHLGEPVTLLLTISASTNSLNAAATSPSPKRTTLNNSGAEGGGARPGDLPTGGNTPVGPVQAGHTEISCTVDRAEEAMNAMNTMIAWKGAIGVIKQVLDAIGPIADVRLTLILRICCFAELAFALQLLPHAQLAWKMLSKIPEVRLHALMEDRERSMGLINFQTLLLQLQRDDNVQTLLEAIQDGFEFAREADALKNMEPASTQARILDEMLECVTECARFIISYAEDVQVGTSSWRLLLAIHHGHSIFRKADFEECREPS
jgi:hypothetical protein